jgi:beta-glucosidase
MQKQFLWGVSTSSYQTEGGIFNNDWHFFTTSNAIKNRVSCITKPNLLYKGSRQIKLEPAVNAAMTWYPEIYLKDFDNAKSLGMNAFRISIEWSRIQPNRGEWNEDAINHYKHMIISMRKKGLTPIITLNHLTLPLWVCTPPSKIPKKFYQHLMPSPLRCLPLSEPSSTDPYWKSLKGWENPQTVRDFIKFVEKIVYEFKNYVDHWITISEPISSIIGGGYIAGIWPPGFLLDGKRAINVLHNLIEAHVKAYDTITCIDDVDSDGDGVPKKVGLSHMMLDVKADEPNKILDITVKDNVEAAKNFSYFVNDYFLNAILNGEEDLHYLKTMERHCVNSNDFLLHEDWKNKTDFIGINYYRRVHVYHSRILDHSSARFVGGAIINDLNLLKRHEKGNPIGLLSDLGWEIYPKGLYNIIMQINNNFKNIPIFVTENGIADKSDNLRAPFIIAHLKQLRQAMHDGANIIGYLHWSLIDNYEWHEKYNPEGKFGLFRIDYDNQNYERSITKAATALKLIIEETLYSKEDDLISERALSIAADRFGIFNPDGSIIRKNDIHGKPFNNGEL